jgi:hypothetical protein
LVPAELWQRAFIDFEASRLEFDGGKIEQIEVLSTFKIGQLLAILRQRSAGDLRPDGESTWTSDRQIEFTTDGTLRAGKREVWLRGPRQQALVRALVEADGKPLRIANALRVAGFSAGVDSLGKAFKDFDQREQLLQFFRRGRGWVAIKPPDKDP